VLVKNVGRVLVSSGGRRWIARRWAGEDDSRVSGVEHRASGAGDLGRRGDREPGGRRDQRR
jgi:hypothetical protein